MSRIALSAAVVASVALSAACGPPEVKHPYKADDHTPANSTSERRLAGEDPNRPKTSSQPSSANGSSSSDPTTPQMNKLGEAPKEPNEPTTAKPGSKNAAPAPASAPAEGKGTKPSRSGPKISKAECEKVLDHALELEINARASEFAGIDKQQLMAQAKAIARQKQAEAPPCDATRSQYDCGMAAQSTEQWKRCMQ